MRVCAGVCLLESGQFVCMCRLGVLLCRCELSFKVGVSGRQAVCAFAPLQRTIVLGGDAFSCAFSLPPNVTDLAHSSSECECVCNEFD